MATVQAPVAGPGVRLSGVDWQTYTRLLRAFAEHPGVRLTYDRGELEIMTISPEHEGDTYLLGRFVDMITLELGLPVRAGRSTTLRRRRRNRGLEPDNCYWVLSDLHVRGKRRIDLRTDPPPDLAIEVNCTRSSLNRLGIYAALGVPEIWRLDRPRLSFLLLGSDGKYTEGAHSRVFPFLAPGDLLPFLDQAAPQGDTAAVQAFVAWLRQRLAAGSP